MNRTVKYLVGALTRKSGAFITRARPYTFCHRQALSGQSGTILDGDRRWVGMDGAPVQVSKPYGHADEAHHSSGGHCENPSCIQ